MRLIEFLLEGYKEALADFSAKSNPSLAKELIDKYKDLVNKNQVQGDERNIDFWRKKGFEEFRSFVTVKAAQPTKTQIKKKKVVGKSINLIENNTWLIIIPLDKQASCFHGKESNWCTTKIKGNYFEEYFENGQILLIYCLQKLTGKMWAIAAHKKLNKVELFDKQDKRVSVKRFIEETGLDPIELKDKAFLEHGPTIQRAMDKQTILIQDYLKLIPTLSDRNNDIEKHIIKLQNKPSDLLQDLVFSYFKKIGKRDYPVEFFDAARKIVKNKSSNLLKYLPNISKDLLMQTLSDDPSTIRLFKNPNDYTKKLAIEKNAAAIRYIDNPGEDLIINTVLRVPGLFVFFNNNENLQKTLIRNDPFMITKQNKHYFTPEVQDLAKSLISKIEKGEIADPRRSRDYPNYNQVINWPRN